MAGKIKRSKLAIFLNTNQSTQQPQWALIGDGVTEQVIAYNPQVSEEVYVHQDSGVTDVESYRLNIATPMTAIAGDPVFDFVDGLRRRRSVLADARTQCCMVYLYGEKAEKGYPAERNQCAIQIDDFGGAGGESAKLNFTLNLLGDGETGYFDPVTKVFTPAAEEATNGHAES